MSTIKVNTIKDTSGTEVYTAKAWVNFNGTGTVAIRAAGNVSSITDNGTGNYTVNFTTAMADANYSWTTAEQRNLGADQALVKSVTYNTDTVSTTSLQIRFFAVTPSASGFEDALTINVAIFR